MTTLPFLLKRVSRLLYINYTMLKYFVTHHLLAFRHLLYLTLQPVEVQAGICIQKIIIIIITLTLKEKTEITRTVIILSICTSL